MNKFSSEVKPSDPAPERQKGSFLSLRCTFPPQQGALSLARGALLRLTLAFLRLRCAVESIRLALARHSLAIQRSQQGATLFR